MSKALSHEEARRVYDRIGSFQDSQAFYEDRTTRELLEHGRFETASRVFEFGCGTGRFAETLLQKQLPSGATYRGIDISPKTIELARKRLAPFGPRVELSLSDGGAPASEPSGYYDRWISTFVLDLLSSAEIDAVLAEAHRMLQPNGLLCLAGLSSSHHRLAKLVGWAWSALHKLSPALVGGCRPVDLLPRLGHDRWTIVHHRSLAPFLVPSEAVVALRR